MESPATRGGLPSASTRVSIIGRQYSLSRLLAYLGIPELDSGDHWVLSSPNGPTAKLTVSKRRRGYWAVEITPDMLKNFDPAED